MGNFGSQFSARRKPKWKYAKVLFILKAGQGYGTNGYVYGKGLEITVRFFVDMLNEMSIEAKAVVVNDNNDIDREVTAYQPTHVFIEALWVVPEKFDILQQLHPTVTWIVSLHSEVAFLAQEGIAMEWILQYVQKPNVYVSVNEQKAALVLQDLTGGEKILLLPNFYPYVIPRWAPDPNESILNIGCFGAIRPLKNQLIQAVAAIELAKEYGAHLRFHINSTRVELGGESVLRNIRALFAGGGNELIEHPWLEHQDFLDLVRTMDLSMQLSFSETFNVVTADGVATGTPVLASGTIDWLSSESQTSVDKVDAIVLAMDNVLSNVDTITAQNKALLDARSIAAAYVWRDYLIADI